MKKILVFLVKMTITILAMGTEVSMARPQVEASVKAAWIDDLHTIRAVVTNNIHADQLRILSHEGVSLNTFEIKKEKRQVIFKFKKNLNLENNYQIIFNEKKTWVKPTLNLLNNYFVTDEFLGVKNHDRMLKAALWSPTATAVNFLLYDRDAKTLLGTLPMQRKNNGVWYGNYFDDEFKVQNFEHLYYQFEVTAFGETHKALDPYAKSMAAFDPTSFDKAGKGAIVNIENSTLSKYLNQGMANGTDFIAYEAHIHDFTIDPNLPMNNEEKGTYKGFSKVIPHLKDLGITHVQFMPLQNFYTVNENDRSYQGADIPVKKVNYNWGYDPLNYFTPEGWYSLNPKDPHLRLLEVKKLFSDLHEQGIGVILDVVYNHLYKESTLENIAPGCYLRKNESGEISHGTGAGVTLESRNLMARRLIIDSLKHWQNYFGADGFRFDLMGFMDQETMKEIRKALGSDAILYGEAWNFTDLPFDEATTKTNFPHDANLSVFNDSSRDSYAGRNEARGFAQGVYAEAPRVKTGIIGGLKKFPDPHGEILTDNYHRYANAPFETLNYLAIHDGFTLWDKINLSNGQNKVERERIARLSLGMLFTSQGRIVLHGGDEIGRSKPLSFNDPHPDRAHTSTVVDPENGISIFHENSYASPDTTNMIDWNRGQEFSDLKNYLKGLIKLRRITPGLRYLQASSIIKGLRFIEARPIKAKFRSVIAYIIDNTLEDFVAKGLKKSAYKNILVVHNADSNDLKIKLAEIKDANKWDILVDAENAGINPIKNSRVQVTNGEVAVPRKSTVVLGEKE